MCVSAHQKSFPVSNFIEEIIKGTLGTVGKNLDWHNLTEKQPNNVHQEPGKAIVLHKLLTCFFHPQKWFVWIRTEHYMIAILIIQINPGTWPRIKEYI